MSPLDCDLDFEAQPDQGDDRALMIELGRMFGGDERNETMGSPFSIDDPPEHIKRLFPSCVSNTARVHPTARELVAGIAKAGDESAFRPEGYDENNSTNTGSEKEPLEPDTVAAIDFLAKMFGDRDRHLVAIVPDGALTAKTFAAQDLAGAHRWIDEQQGRAGVYYSVNALKAGLRDKKATKADVAEALFIHVDIDDPSALNKICCFEPRPTVAIFSGGGYQCLWRLKAPNTDLAEVEKVNEALAAAFKADHCHNIDRVLRVPGTINLPNVKKRAGGRVPALAYVVHELTDWSRASSLEDFSRLPPPSTKDCAKADSATIRPVRLDELPAGVGQATRTLIMNGDDLSRPIGGANARFPSRSEAVWRVACELARAGCSENTIAGVLINPDHGISSSILEKRSPKVYANRQALQAISVVGADWPDRDRNGNIKATLRNAKLAMQRLDLQFSFNEFRQRKFVQGHALQEYQGELTDDRCAALRNLVLEQFGFDPGSDHTRDALNMLCLEHRHHPICDYLDRIEWDGAPRLSELLPRYFGATSTPFNIAIGRAILIAAVRRVRDPGCKFDTITVLEGAQGTGKSTALSVLAGAENISDNDILALDSKAQMEAVDFRRHDE